MRLRSSGWFLPSLLVATAAFAPGATAPQESPAELLGRFDRAVGEQVEDVLEALLALGPDAARVALAELPDLEPAQRRRRALLVREAGDAALVAPVVRRLEPARALESDPEVRRALVEFLGRTDLGPADLEARLDVLEDLCVDDPDGTVRRAALDAFAGLDQEGSVERLDRILDLLPPGERLYGAALLAAEPRARRIVVDRVQRGFLERASPSFDRPPTPSDVLALLLDVAYGRTLAESPSGGRSQQDRMPFAAGLRHPHPGVRSGAAAAREDFVRRLRQLGEFERADEFLQSLLGQGLDDRELLLQRAQLALVAGEDPAPALEAARAIDIASRGAVDLYGRAWAFRAALLEACAQLAGGRLEEVAPVLDRAAALADGLVRERIDTRSPSRILAQATFVEWRGLVHVARALLLIAQGAPPGDAAVVREAYGIHVASLRSQILTASSPDVPATMAPPVGGLDSLLVDQAISPLALTLGNPRLPAWPRPRSIEVRRSLYRALAGVAAREMPGFEPPDTVDSDPLEDPERLRLLRAVRDQYVNRLILELRSLEPEDPQVFGIRQAISRLSDQKTGGRERELAGLRLLRYPSERALELVQLLSAEGRNDEARAIAERMLRDAEAEPEGLAAAANALLVASIELALGSARMDQGEPVEAERILLGALERIENLERGLRDRGANPAGLRRVVSMRSQILVGLAVNANVRLLAPEKALDYFERAYAVRRDDFMRVLLACYRARAGREDEARALIRQLTPAPGNYYNLACTHALLGDVELALDYLQRELTENHYSAGSLEQQQEWARGDPDLESLRGGARFEDLLDMSLEEARQLARRAR